MKTAYTLIKQPDIPADIWLFDDENGMMEKVASSATKRAFQWLSGGRDG